MEELTYEQVIELEENIKLKNKAEKIYYDFLENAKIDIKAYKKNGKFLIWNDTYNAIYLTLKNELFYFQCEFLHETYSIEMKPSGIFNALKNKRSGIGHLEHHKWSK